MSDLTNLLEQIREKPLLFLGVPSVTRLRFYLLGYRKAKNVFHCGDNDPLLDEFQDFVEARFDLRTDHGWAESILFMAQDERRGYELFWELFDEFMAKRSQQTILPNG